MPIRTIEENRYLLRRYIRLLSLYPKIKEHKDAIKYFIIIHNFLGIEDLFYDQCLMSEKQINNHLNLMSTTRFAATALMYYRNMYDPNHRVRFAIETIDSIEDVRLFLKSDECKDIHSKLILEWETIKSKRNEN